MRDRLAREVLWGLAQQEQAVDAQALAGQLPSGCEFGQVLDTLNALKRGGLVKLGARAWELSSEGRRLTEGLELLTGIQAGRGTPAERRPDAAQDTVVQAPISARLVVQAGPGYGKTDVACARVARLVSEEGVDPSSLLLLSFTRTAVKEMRSRIGALAASGADVADVEIRTLDSFAWHVRTNQEASSEDQVDTYDDSIRLLSNRLSQPSPELRDALSRYNHVFVDEAQDLHDHRVSLVVGLLAAVRDDCGWTVFLDPAQAIYGWDEAEAPLNYQHLLDKVDPHDAIELRTLYRTKNPDLKQLLLRGRRLVLDKSTTEQQARLRALLNEKGGGPERPIGEMVKAERGLLRSDASDLFVLLRSRAQALETSNWLAGLPDPVQHRLRFGGLPTIVSPWVAPVVHGAFRLAGSDVVVREEHVRQAFENVPNPWLRDGWDSQQAWLALRRVGGTQQRNRLDLRRIADAISTGGFPDDLFHREIGTTGPIVGTTHGAKGRESERVLMVVAPASEDSGLESELQEARVLYVALSRAKAELHVRHVKSAWWGKLSSGRVWKRTKRSAFRVEVGRAGDINPAYFLSGRDWSAVEKQQSLLSAFDGKITNLSLFMDRDRRKRWLLRLQDRQPIAEMDNCFRDDISEALRRSNVRALPSGPINHVRWFGVTTVALRRDHAMLRDIPEPWRTLRCWLMPVVSGLGWFKIRSY